MKTYLFRLSTNEGTLTEVKQFENDVQAGIGLAKWIIENADSSMMEVPEDEYPINEQMIGD